MGRKRPPSEPPAIRCDCPVCGTVVVEISVVNVLLRNTGDGNGLLFRCPKCLDLIERAGIGRDTTCALMAVGVTVIDQMIEALSYPGRPALTESDAEAFEKSIEHVTFFAAHARRECARYRRELLGAQ